MNKIFTVTFFLFVVTLSAQSEDSEYKKKFNASLKLLENTVVNPNQTRNFSYNSLKDSTTVKNKTKPALKSTSNNLKSHTDYLNLEKIKNLPKFENNKKFQVYETHGGKTQILTHQPVKPKSISEQNEKSLKAILGIPK